MIIEKGRIENYLINGEGTVSKIILDHLAVPETVRVFFLGEKIIPIGFDYLGNPIFSHEQSMLFGFKREEFMRRGGTYPDMQVNYEERIFDVPRSEFDTLQSIEKSLHSLSAFENVIRSRRMFAKSHRDEELKEFIVFGRLRLKYDGELSHVDTDDCSQTKDVVETSRIPWYMPSYIPSAGAICPCCGKPFTIEDVKNGTYEFVDCMPWHRDCWYDYRRRKEIHKVINGLMDHVYESDDEHQCQYELLPNGYWGDTPHVPWFLYHTPDGDIIVGWRKRVISIEWQENFKPFDFEKLFGSENVTKWQKNGKRGIHAWGVDKAVEYLKKVLKAVNP